ncbi:hypothetical protein AB0F49_00165 [Micromonospora ureilytica]|uniref:hypothetical protein n=1 Tax=Micromonospora ureilytica TaxID=709868 RepID=UPI0033FF2BCF
MSQIHRAPVQRWVSAGYQPPHLDDPPVTLVFGPAVRAVPQTDPAAAEHLRALPRAALSVLLPTYVARCDAELQAAALDHVLGRLKPIRHEHPDLPVIVWLGMQSDDRDGGEAVDRLTQVLANRAAQDGVTVVGLAIPGRGKLRTINAAIRVSRELGCRGWVWIDDDVELDEFCLSRLVTRFFDRGGRGAVGGTETALVGEAVPARLMGALSTHTVPPYSYPKAACMLVATAVLADGISPRRFTDDGFVLFELLARASDHAPPDFEMVTDARYRYFRVSRSGDTLRRLRRSMYSHVTCMADYPWRAAHRYFAQHLFYGLWPLAPWDGRRGPVRGLVRWGLKAIHFTWFCWVALGLAARALVGRPLRQVGWGDDGDFRTPLSGRA